MKSKLAILFLLWSLPTMAQLHFKSFEEVLQYADNHAIALRGAAINEQIVLSEKKEAKSFLIPSLTASLGYNDNITLQPTLVPAQLFNPGAPEDTFEEMTFGTRYLYSRGIQAQWDVLNFQKVFAAKTADLRVAESKVSTEVNRFNTYNQLASTYYAVLLTQEAIHIYEENTRVAATIFEHASEKYQKGMISEAERNGAEIKYLQTQRTLELSEDNLQQLLIQLQGYLNTNERITISDTPQGFNLTQTDIPTIHPEILWEEAKLETYESVLKQQKALRLPSINFYYQYNQNFATNDFMGFADANTLPQQVFGINLSLSGLFNYSTGQKIKQSKWKVDLQQEQVRNTRLVKNQEDHILELNRKQTAKQVAKNQQILALQQKNDVHAENKYLADIISLDNRLDKYDDLLAAQDSYLSSLADYTLAQYKIYIRQTDFQANLIR